jgi:nicotinamide-nucleotide amidase
MLYDKSVITRISEKLKAKKLTVAVAESVTSGHLQAAMSLAPDASLFFQGGLTAYNLGQKCKHLLINPIHAQECDCVSEKVAKDMAREVSRQFISDYGMAITGYATKVPERGINELYAFVAITLNENLLLSTRLVSAEMDTEFVQIGYVNSLLESFEKILSGTK